MIWRVAADGVLLLHLAFVLFATLGGFLVLRWRRLIYLHLPAVAWGLWIELSGRICPLTPLENHLRRLGGEAGYAGGFIEHYLLALLYPAALTRDMQMWLALALLLTNLVAYALVWRTRVRPRLPGSGPQ